MFAANTYKLRLATEDDADALRRLAELDSRAPIAGRVLIGELAGSPAAALSLDDDRVIADPFRRTDHLVACMRIRAGAIRAHEATPSLDRANARRAPHPRGIARRPQRQRTSPRDPGDTDAHSPPTETALDSPARRHGAHGALGPVGLSAAGPHGTTTAASPTRCGACLAPPGRRRGGSVGTKRLMRRGPYLAALDGVDGRPTSRMRAVGSDARRAVERQPPWHRAQCTPKRPVAVEWPTPSPRTRHERLVHLARRGSQSSRRLLRIPAHEPSSGLVSRCDALPRPPARVAIPDRARPGGCLVRRDAVERLELALDSELACVHGGASAGCL